jgi:hypothetical protein
MTSKLRALWLCAGALGLACPALAQELLLSFEFPRDVQPAPESFLVSMLRDSGVPELSQFRLPNGGRASCDAVEDADMVDDSICGRTPSCLPPGIYSFWVQGEWGSATSPMSNVASCEALEGCRYACDQVTVPAAVQALITNPDGTPAQLDPDKLQAFLDGHTSATPASPSAGPPVQGGATPPPAVTQKAPTATAVEDKVGPALKAMQPLPG